MRRLLPLILLATLSCATTPGHPMAAEEDLQAPAEEAAKPAARNRNVTAAPRDASICVVEPTGKTEKELVPSDVGKTVVVEGEMRLSMLICSTLFCEVKCCNRCGALIVIGGDAEGLGGVQVATLGGERVNCGGTDCGMTCPGFVPGNHYRVQGKLRAAPMGKGPYAYSLDAETVCRRAFE